MQVTFPGLGLDLFVSDVAFELFGFPVYWYGVLIVTGFLLALSYVWFNYKRFHLDFDKLLDVIIVSTVSAIVGARLYYVVFSFNDYKNDFWSIFDLRAGGLAIYGGLIFALGAAYLYCRWKKLRVLDIFDIASLGFLIGQAVGRWGNFTNQEAFGHNTNLPWGMYSQNTYDALNAFGQNLGKAGAAMDVSRLDPNTPVHPCFLYESLWCLLGFVLLHYLSKRRRFSGQIILCYGIWYGIGRVFIEGLRTDSLMFLGGRFRVSQLISLLLVLACGGMLAGLMHKLRKGKTQPDGETPVAEAAAGAKTEPAAFVVEEVDGAEEFEGLDYDLFGMKVEKDLTPDPEQDDLPE